MAGLVHEYYYFIVLHNSMHVKQNKTSSLSGTRPDGMKPITFLQDVIFYQFFSNTCFPLGQQVEQVIPVIHIHKAIGNRSYYNGLGDGDGADHVHPFGSRRNYQTNGGGENH